METPSIVASFIAAEVEYERANSGSEWEPDSDTQPDVIQQEPEDSAGQEPERHPESHAGRQAGVYRLVVVLVFAHLAEGIRRQPRREIEL